VFRPDLSAGTAKLLILDSYSNKTVLLSGNKAFTVEETAALVGEVVKKKVRTEIVFVVEYVDIVGKGKLGPEFAKLWATTYDGLKRGECATVDPLLGHLIGPLTPLEDVLKSYS